MVDAFIVVSQLLVIVKTTQNENEFEISREKTVFLESNPAACKHNYM